MAEHIERIGQQVGDYRLLRQLGNGGFGTVYLGEHIRTQYVAAVKILHVQLTQPDALKKFINEARTIRLQHPHIMRILDFGISADNEPFLVMDYAANGTLRNRHPKGSRLPFTVIVGYVKPIASALQYAHNLQLVHRDVKPENMLLGPHEELLLSDFGLATFVEDTVTQGDTLTHGGTAPYMAPEQIQGKPCPASDQYALGVVTYEWLTGTRPFQGSPLEILIHHISSPPPPLREHVLALSPEIEQVVLTALAKDPKQRFASVQAFATALEQAGLSSGIAESTLQLPIPSLPSEQTTPRQEAAPAVDTQNPSSPSNEQPIVPIIQENPPISPIDTSGASSSKLASGSGSRPVSSPSLEPVMPEVVARPPRTRRKSAFFTGKNLLLVGMAIVLVVVLGLNLANPNSTLRSLVAPVVGSLTAHVAAPTQASMASSVPAGWHKSVDPLADNSQGNRWSEDSGPFGRTTSCYFKDSTYHVEREIAGSDFLVSQYTTCVANAIFVTDFAFDVQMNLTSSIDSGIVFGVNNTGFYFFYISQDQHLQSLYTLLYCPSSGCETLKMSNAGALNNLIFKSQNPWNTVGVIVKGQQFTFFVNGAQVAQVSSNQYSQGVIGVGVGVANVPPDIAFRNAEIWTPPSL